MGIVGCITLILGIFFGDLWIKNRIEAMDEDSFPKKKLQGKIELRRYHNTGAMLNLGAAKQTAVKAAAIGLTLLLTIVFIGSLGQHGKKTLRTGLALLLGGSFSNIYDRMKRGYVVDYFGFPVKWKWLRKIVFNLSDFCIMIGALLMAIGA